MSLGLLHGMVCYTAQHPRWGGREEGRTLVTFLQFPRSQKPQDTTAWNEARDSRGLEFGGAVAGRVYMSDSMTVCAYQVVQY